MSGRRIELGMARWTRRDATRAIEQCERHQLGGPDENCPMGSSFVAAGRPTGLESRSRSNGQLTEGAGTAVTK